MLHASRFDISVISGWHPCRGRCETMSEAMKTKHAHPERLFKDGWRPEDKAIESAEEGLWNVTMEMRCEGSRPRHS